MLADEVAAEAVMRFGSDQAKARRLVDMPRGDQDALGPQGDFPVATVSLTSRAPMPSPRAAGSISSSRNLAICSVSLTRNTEPTGSPSRSAIQQHSRPGSNSATNLAAISATSASKRQSKPYSCAYNAPWREITQPISPGTGGRNREGSLGAE